MKRLLIIIILGTILGVVGVVMHRIIKVTKNEEVATTVADPSMKAAPVVLRSVEREAGEIQVIGEIRQPGRFWLTKPTLVRALAHCGGPTTMANLKKVKIRHFTKPGFVIKTIEIDITPIIKGEAGDIPLENGDAIFVPMRIL